MSDSDLVPAVIAASRSPAALQAVTAVYQALAEAIDTRRPLCRASGDCCRFEAWGHRLYVTTLELAKFVAERQALVAEQTEGCRSGRSLAVLTERPVASWDGTGCPFQVQGLCSVHGIRPFGCRIFFCDATSTAWQHEQYERLHSRLREAHDAVGAPYHYVEWRYALRELGIASSGAAGEGG